MRSKTQQNKKECIVGPPANLRAPRPGALQTLRHFIRDIRIRYAISNFRVTPITTMAMVVSTARSQGFGEAHLHNPKVVADMTSLHHIHEAGILHNLGQRAQLGDQNPYTFMVSF